MSEKVAVFDPESKDLRILPKNKIDASKFDKVDMPRLRRRFDVYESYGMAKGTSHASHAIVTRPTDEIEDKSFLARLHMGRLGVMSEIDEFARVRVQYNTGWELGADNEEKKK